MGRLQKETAKVKKKEVSEVNVLSGDEEWWKNIQSGLAKHHELKLPSSHCSYFFEFRFSPKRKVMTFKYLHKSKASET